MQLEHKELKYRGKVVFESIKMMGKFRRVPKIFNENEACFLFLTKGAFVFRTPTNLLHFNEGDAMLSKCGNYFIEQVAINDEFNESTIVATGAFFYPEMVKEFFTGDLSIESIKPNFDTTKLSVEPLLKAFVDSINYMLDNPAIADENLIETKLKELLLLLSKTEKASSIHQFIHSLFIPYEYEFRDIIQLNLFSNLSLEELARLCNMSLATFKRKFTETYKQSPAKYLLEQKLKNAQYLLEHSKIPVSDIAHQCGFDDLSGFNKAFKKEAGLSPSDYRLSRKS